MNPKDLWLFFSLATIISVRIHFDDAMDGQLHCYHSENEIVV